MWAAQSMKVGHVQTTGSESVLYHKVDSKVDDNKEIS